MMAEVIQLFFDIRIAETVSATNNATAAVRSLIGMNAQLHRTVMELLTRLDELDEVIEVIEDVNAKAALADASRKNRSMMGDSMHELFDQARKFSILSCEFISANQG